MRRLVPAPASLSHPEFAARYGVVWEHSLWIAERAFRAGLGPETETPEGLAAAMGRVVDAAEREEQLALLRAHPDLAGRLALAGELTEASKAEQAGAGLDRCSPEELAEFTALNDRYVRKFGFPFIVAVKGLTRAEILERFRRRVENDPETEFAEALAQVKRIARLRLEALADR